MAYVFSSLPCFSLQTYLTLRFLSQCNKMSCPNCHTLSCYICRQVINGYDHFNQVGVLVLKFFIFHASLLSRYYVLSCWELRSSQTLQLFYFLNCDSFFVVFMRTQCLGRGLMALSCFSFNVSYFLILFHPHL